MKVGTVIKWIILIVILAVLALVVGPCVYYNFIAKPDTGMLDMPDQKEATHSFYIVNSGGLILASDYEQQGQTEGSRVFILHGFWEVRGNKFKFVEGDIILNEKIFGKIEVKRRK